MAAAIAGFCRLPAAAAPVAPIYGGPTYDAATGSGLTSFSLPAFPGATAGNGTGVGYATKSVNNVDLGTRAIRWNASGAATELGNLGTDSNGQSESQAYAVNTGGTSVGSAMKYNGDVELGNRAVRWDASGTAATELGSIDASSSGESVGEAYAINNDGTSVGLALKYNGNVSLGARAVRWDASTGAATELGNLGANSGGNTFSRAVAINASGTAVGSANKYSGNNSLGRRAVRWDAASTTATELGNLGTSNGGLTTIEAYAVNAFGVAVGYADKYVAGTRVGTRGVRWDASGVATELDSFDASVASQSKAFDVNDAGVAIGQAGTRAVRWNAAGVATELMSLDPATAASGITGAYALNNKGIAVGACLAPGIGVRAVAWKADGIAIDMNTLLSPANASRWSLSQAFDLSDSYWVTGTADFDPDGSAGPMHAYSRAFLLDVISVFGTPGDATRDDRVNFDDLIPVARNYNKPSGQRWDDGDFTGDGAVNFNDLILLAKLYNTGNEVGSETLSGLASSFTADWSLAQSLVPEPASLASIGCATALLHCRRRRVNSFASRIQD